MFFVEVILPLSLAKTFTYSISEAEFHYIQKGMRIAVPFGKSKVYTALAVEVHQNKPSLYEAKEIHEILDEKPIVNGTFTARSSKGEATPFKTDKVGNFSVYLDPGKYTVSSGADATLSGVIESFPQPRQQDVHLTKGK